MPCLLSRSYSARIRPVKDGGGGGGGEDTHRLVLDFSWGDASPEAIGTLPADKTALAVLLSIETAFNGSGAALSVGPSGSPAALMATSQNDPATAAQYETFPGISYGTDRTLYLTITPGSGASTGHGQVVIEYE